MIRAWLAAALVVAGDWLRDDRLKSSNEVVQARLDACQGRWGLLIQERSRHD